MKFHILGIVLGVIFGIPAIAFGSSFAVSLAHGKTASEAVSVVPDQLQHLFGKVNDTETQQTALSAYMDALEKDNNSLQAQVKSQTQETSSTVAHLNCSELARDVPVKGEYQNWGDVSTITKFYTQAKYLIDSGTVSQDSYGAQQIFAEVLPELKQKYTTYVSKCGGPAYDITLPTVNASLCTNLNSEVAAVNSDITIVEAEKQKNQPLPVPPDETVEETNQRVAHDREVSDSFRAQIDADKDKKEDLESQQQSNNCGLQI